MDKTTVAIVIFPNTLHSSFKEANQKFWSNCKYFHLIKIWTEDVKAVGACSESHAKQIPLIENFDLNIPWKIDYTDIFEALIS